jgi:hypothetical protein
LHSKCEFSVKRLAFGKCHAKVGLGKNSVTQPPSPDHRSPQYASSLRKINGVINQLRILKRTNTVRGVAMMAAPRICRQEVALFD